MKIKCGDANPKGNVAMLFKGGCGKDLKIEDAYRCTGCGGYFHLDCIFEHFKLEEKHDYAHNALLKIHNYAMKFPASERMKHIIGIAKRGLSKKLKKRRLDIKEKEIEKFRFLGDEKDPWTKKQGIKHGEVYKIEICNRQRGFDAFIHTEKSIIVCPYASQNAFYNNWLKIK